MELRSAKGEIDLLYDDETQISEEGYVPYGWQFTDESVSVPSVKSAHINCFVLLSKDNRFIHQTTSQNITSDFVIEQLDALSFTITKHTVVVLDNAKVHRSKKVKDQQPVWAGGNLFVFFLPPYSPHLNIIERLWKGIKTRWFRPQDYISPDQLFYSVNRILHAVGQSLFIHFKSSTFNVN